MLLQVHTIIPLGFVADTNMKAYMLSSKAQPRRRSLTRTALAPIMNSINENRQVRTMPEKGSLLKLNSHSKAVRMDALQNVSKILTASQQNKENIDPKSRGRSDPFGNYQYEITECPNQSRCKMNVQAFLVPLKQEVAAP